MPLFAHMPIKRRLTLIIVGTCATALMPACLALAIYETIAFNRTLRENLSTMASSLERTASPRSYSTIQRPRNKTSACSRP